MKNKITLSATELNTLSDCLIALEKYKPDVFLGAVDLIDDTYKTIVRIEPHSYKFWWETINKEFQTNLDVIIASELEGYLPLEKQKLSLVEFKHTDFNDHYDCIHKYKTDQDLYMELFYKDPESKEFKALLARWMTLSHTVVSLDNVINAPEKLYVGDVLNILVDGLIVEYPIKGIAIQDGSYVNID